MDSLDLIEEINHLNTSDREEVALHVLATLPDIEVVYVLQIWIKRNRDAFTQLIEAEGLEPVKSAGVTHHPK